MKAINVACYLVELANKAPEHDLTNLKIQKLLYYIQGKHLSATGRPLFDEKIEAWQYGPVVPEVYHEFKKCGAFPVTEFDLGSHDSSNLSSSVKKHIEDVWDKIGVKYSGSFLVRKTHAPGTPWKKYYQAAHSIEIPQDELRKYFATNTL
jgi:uncharacterized phage-associated protein